MQDNTNNPKLLIIDFLNEQIKKEEQDKEYWALSSTSAAQKLRISAVHRLGAFYEVLEFIEENFKPEQHGN